MNYIFCLYLQKISLALLERDKHNSFLKKIPGYLNDNFSRKFEQLLKPLPKVLFTFVLRCPACPDAGNT